MKWITEVMEDNARKRQKEAIKNFKLNYMNNETPRRVQLDKFVAAEKAIYDAMQEVEKMPADPILTEAVILLGQAKDRVADFVDGVSD